MRPLYRDLLVGFSMILLAVGSPLTIDLFVNDAVPFALTFPAVIIAGLLAGWRGVLITIAGCQLLVWYFVMPPQRSFAIVDAGQATSLMLTTLAQLLSAWAVVAYRTSSLRLADETGKHLDLMQIAQQEIDHRTKNNFQLAASLLMAQAAQADTQKLREQLNAAAARLQRVAGTYKNLWVSSVGLSEVALDSHLAELCESLRVAMLPPGVTLVYEGQPVTVDADRAVAIGLIANEWITNAAKHAYDEGEGKIEVRLTSSTEAIELGVVDGGCGIANAPRGGLGTSLVEMLSASLEARMTVTDDNGTRCVLRVSR